MSIQKWISITTLGFLVADVLIATNHLGRASEFINYLFGLLFLLMTSVLLNNEVKD